MTDWTPEMRAKLERCEVVLYKGESRMAEPVAAALAEIDRLQALINTVCTDDNPCQYHADIEGEVKRLGAVLDQWPVMHKALGAERDELQKRIDDHECEDIARGALDAQAEAEQTAHGYKRALEVIAEKSLTEHTQLRARVAELENWLAHAASGHIARDHYAMQQRVAGLEGALRATEKGLMRLWNREHNLGPDERIGDGSPDAIDQCLAILVKHYDQAGRTVEIEARAALDGEGGQGKKWWGRGGRNSTLGAGSVGSGPLPVSKITGEEVDRLLVEGQEGRRELHEQLDGMQPTAETMQTRLRSPGAGGVEAQPVDVGEIVQAHLRANGFDGLCYPGECACLTDDLAPCGEIHTDCEPGYRVDFKDRQCSGGCADGGCDWHIETKRPDDTPTADTEEPARRKCGRCWGTGITGIEPHSWPEEKCPDCDGTGVVPGGDDDE